MIYFTTFIYIFTAFIVCKKKFSSWALFVFSPFFFFTVINFILYHLAPFLIDYLSIYEYQNLSKITALAIISQVSIFIVMMLSKNIKPATRNLCSSSHGGNVFLPLIFINIAIFFLFVSSFVDYGFADFNSFYKDIRRGGNAWKVMLAYLTVYIPFIYLYYKHTYNIKFFLLLFISVIIALLTGARIGLLEIIFIFLAYKLNTSEIKSAQIIMYVLLGLALILSMTVLRMVGSESQDITVNLAQELLLFFSLSVDMTIHFDRVITYVAEVGILWGRTLIDIVYYFLPSRFFDKPMSSEAARTIYHFASSEGVGYNFGMLAIDFLNFGYLGAVFLPVLWFMFFNANYYRMVVKDTNKNNALNFLNLFIFVKILIVLRLGVFTHFLGLFLFQFLGLIFILLICEGYRMMKTKRMVR